MQRRDLVAIGSSAGGIEALPALFAQIPRDTAAAFLVVQHLSSDSPGMLPSIIQRSTSMEVKFAADGERILSGHVYVAPTGTHLQIEDEHARLTLGAKENFVRPSINRLFRSVAAAYGGRTIGVLLTGMLDDGVLGLASIQRSGGRVVIQDPEDAAFPDMPRAALEAMTPDHVVPLAATGATIAALTQEAASAEPPPPDVKLHAELDRLTEAQPSQLDELGPRTELRCPACGGPTWDIGYGRVRGYRCYLGHAHGARALLAGQASEVERSLWVAIRALQERATTLADLARSVRQSGDAGAADRRDAEARAARAHAERAREILLEHEQGLPPLL